MNLVLRGLTWDICCPYVDDIICMSRFYDEHKVDLPKAHASQYEVEIRQVCDGANRA